MKHIDINELGFIDRSMFVRNPRAHRILFGDTPFKPKRTERKDGYTRKPKNQRAMENML